MSRPKRPQGLQQSLPRFTRVIQRLWPQIRSETLLLVGAFVAMVTQIAMRVLEPWPLKFLFDGVFGGAPSNERIIERVVSALSPPMLIAGAAIALVLIVVFRSLADYLSTVALALAGNRVLMKIRGDLYQQLLRLSLSYHSRSRTGDLVTRITADIGRLQEVAVTAILPLLVHTLTQVTMVALMFWLNWQLTLVALAAFPFFSLSMVRTSGKIRRVARKQREREGLLATNAAEALGAIKVVQAYSLERILQQGFSRQNRRSYKDGVKGKRLAARLSSLVDILTAIGTALVLGFGARQVLQNEMSPGDLLVFMSYLKGAYRPTNSMAKYTGRIAKATASGERVLEVLETQPDIRDAKDAIPAPRFRGAVGFHHVSFEYQAGHPTLKNVTLSAFPGQKIALVGPSGGGKSTLVSLLLRFYDPTRGVITIDGRDIRRYTLQSLRSQISIVLQDSVLFAVSIRDNIAYGSPDATYADVRMAAELANADDFITVLPQGYYTIVGERGETLSGGQRQRIAIARAALRKGPILILDEPATGLDKRNQAIVQSALDRIMRGKTTFIIAHDLRTAENADQILYLEDGRIVEAGTHHQLMRLEKRYAAMYELQAHKRNGQQVPESNGVIVPRR
ncbi:MAG: ABC transporter ATP-binding protein [Anaerolineae bacterium]|nr:ABC transporter ATP-binding protein [Anaerolineae bacterium]